LQPQIVPAGSLLIDTDEVLTAASIAAIKAASPKIVGAIRYVSLVHPGVAGDITAAEAAAIVGAGWGLMLVQHCPFSFLPSTALGEAYGTAAANNALAVGYPKRASLWLDLENFADSGSDLIAYANEWSGIVSALGFLDGVYPAFGQGGVPPLTSDELYWNLTTARYWQPASADAPVPSVRGPCMRQQLPTTIAGVSVDLNVVQVDALGCLPVWGVGA
jgi:Domain of unknown function (DUF1906)